jgi:N-acetyl-D-muramate 6-phosphate phosphatase
MNLHAVLFDLDGTLLDTAPDMGGALNELRAEHDLAPLATAEIRHWVSNGAAALVRLGFGETEPERFEALRQRFLEIYASRVAHETTLFEGGAALLDALDADGIPWGIVTNKPGWLTDPLLEALALRARARVVVSGDTLSEKKPHPQPLLHAAGRLDRSPGACAYVGDAERDMLAARAAGMHGVLATFGYLDPAISWNHWPCVATITQLGELLPWLRLNGLAAGLAPATGALTATT